MSQNEDLEPGTAVESEVGDGAQDQRPALRIVKGNPTAEEIAALVAVFSAVGNVAEEEPEQVSAWASPAVLHRASLPVGAPNAWVLSGR
ncbi:MAG: acyl-CoA carboxylase subunit epsilon [Candidatus Nanopelagicales bacterium]